ncbi:MAG TPA: NrfD/PsrC family molybdoenzyme membrane anchor subunit [Actinomycetota bacterium]|nr:NrfD/PsrC family molybdoenzyme membrane anchor subunit [Actinomycetota bacterium]
MAARTEALPYGVGRPGKAWAAGVLVALALLGMGVVAYVQQLLHGHAVTGLRDWGVMRGAPWGLYVAFVVYFVGVSFAGITTAALIRLANVRTLRPISRMAELLTVTSLVAGALAILADVGQPLRAVVNLLRYARPQSPFFGTFTLVISGYLFASLVYLYLDARADAARCARVPGPLQPLHRLLAAGYRGTPEERERHARTTFWLAIAILPLLVTAHSTLGFVFGLQVGRPGWFSALQAPAFVVLAGVSGLGLLIAIAAAARRALREERRLGPEVFRLLGNLLLVLTLAYLYFVVVEVLTGIYAAPEREAALTRSMLLGRWAWLFWPSVGALGVAAAILGWCFLRGVDAVWPRVVAGVLVNLAAIGKRVLIVVPSLVSGALLPYGEGSYRPTWVEYAIVLGLFGLGTLIYLVAAKVLPIVELPEEVE